MPIKSSAKTKKPKTPKAGSVQKRKEVKEKPLKVRASRDEKEIAVKPVPAEVSVESDDSKALVPEEKSSKKEKYFQAVGRRKESIAIVRLFTKKSTDVIDGDYALVAVNNKDYRDYFTDKILQAIVESPLRKLKSTNRFKATVKVNGGGMSGQADAIKHGLSRALVMFDLNFRKKLKKAGFLTRDSRAKERRKYGLKKARKAPPWTKR